MKDLQQQCTVCLAECVSSFLCDSNQSGTNKSGESVCLSGARAGILLELNGSKVCAVECSAQLVSNAMLGQSCCILSVPHTQKAVIRANRFLIAHCQY